MDPETQKQLAAIQAAITAGETEIKALLDKQTAEVKSAGASSEKTAAELKAAEQRYDQARTDQQAAYKALEEKFTSDLEKAQKRIDELEKAGQRPAWGKPDGEQKSLGQRFVELMGSDAPTVKNVVEAMRSGATRGGPALGFKGFEGAPGFGGLGAEYKSLLSDAATRLVAPMRDLLLPSMRRRLRIRDLMTIVPTQSNAVEFVEQTGFGPETGSAVTSITRAAQVATVTQTAHGYKTFDKVQISGAAETEYNGIFRIIVTGANTYTYVVTGTPATPATGTILARNMSVHGAAAGVAEGGTKPEARMTFELKTAVIQTIAHWIAASRQVLDDLPQLRSMVDDDLAYGILRAEEVQLLYGTGTAPQIQGILTHANIQTYNWSAGIAGDSQIDAVRRAMTKVQVADLEASGAVLHPNDWEKIETKKGSDEHYIWVNVGEGALARLWRLPVVITNAIDETDGLVGAFDMGATLYDRESANVRFSEHHASFFIQNLLALLGEERIAAAWKRPEAFVKVEFDNAPA